MSGSASITNDKKKNWNHVALDWMLMLALSVEALDWMLELASLGVPFGLDIGAAFSVASREV